MSLPVHQSREIGKIPPIKRVKPLRARVSEQRSGLEVGKRELNDWRKPVAIKERHWGKY